MDTKWLPKTPFMISTDRRNLKSFEFLMDISVLPPCLHLSSKSCSDNDYEDDDNDFGTREGIYNFHFWRENKF